MDAKKLILAIVISYANDGRSQIFGTVANQRSVQPLLVRQCPGVEGLWPLNEVISCNNMYSGGQDISMESGFNFWPIFGGYTGGYAGNTVDYRAGSGSCSLFFYFYNLFAVTAFRAAGINARDCPINKGTYRFLSFVVESISTPWLFSQTGKFRVYINSRETNSNQVQCMEVVYKCQ